MRRTSTAFVAALGLLAWALSLPGCKDEREYGILYPEEALVEEAAVEVTDAAEAEGAAAAVEEPAEPEPYQIRTGDVLTISVFGEPEMTQTFPVGPDGRISYYVANDITAAGLTFKELREEITEGLLEHFKDPRVSVVGNAYKGNTVYILGQVRRPGEYIIRSDTRLLDVVAMAGGIARSVRSYAGRADVIELADLSRAFLLRASAFVAVDFQALFSDSERKVAASNVPVRAGDRIYIPSASAQERKVLVLGEVTRPMVVRYQRSISLLEALAEAGDVKKTARDRNAFVVRGSLISPVVYRINIRSVSTGLAKNVILESGDIVYVPKTALAKASEIADQIYPLLRDVETADFIVR